MRDCFILKTPSNKRPGKKTSAEEKLQQLTDLFTAYKKAVSASQWEESGRIMDQIDKLLNQ